MPVHALKITSSTMVASGNCFSVKADDKHEYSIVNFSKERLEGAILKGMLNWPVQIKKLDKSHAVIDDIRIPEQLYERSYCEICCPFSLLPVNQQDAISRNQVRSKTKSTNLILAWDVDELLRK